MAAFGRAVELGYRYLETDVHATADGVLLAFHDPTLDRVTGLAGRVAEQTWLEIQQARVGGTEAIPRLADVLHTWPDIRVNIDVKHPSAVAPLVRTLRAANALDRVCVASFSERRLAAVRRELGPHVCTGLGPRGVALLRAAATSRVASVLARPGVPCAQVPHRLGRFPVVTARLVEVAHDRRQHVHVWTVDDPAEMHRLLDLGVDGIMTDRLETLRDVLTARGQWVD